MKQIIEKIINRINEDSVKINGVFAGSGSSFANWFLATPGSSNTIIQLDFPYSNRSIDELLGGFSRNGTCRRNLQARGKKKTEKIRRGFATRA